MITGLIGIFLGLSLFPVLLISGIVLFISLWCITGEEENKIYILWMCLLAGFLWLRFRPELLTLIFSVVGSIVVGIFYSFYRWFRECRKLRRHLNDVLKSVTEWPAHIYPDLKGCVFNTREAGDESKHSYTFSSEKVCLDMYMPLVEDNRGALTLWILFWFLYVLNDFTFKLIRNIQDALKGLYHRISVKCFTV